MEASSIGWILLWPFIGAATLGLLAALRLSRAQRVAGWIASGAILLSFLQTFRFWPHLVSEAPTKPIRLDFIPWISFGTFEVAFSLTLDSLSVILALVICGVGFLIHLYSIGYMAHDRSRLRYFSYLNLFCGFMLVLVLASNLPLLFVGWEGVGLCSYLLIGFWYEDLRNSAAGKKAFIVNRIGDAGFMLGMFFTFTVFGTLSFSEINHNAAALSLSSPWVLECIAILFFVGCVGKSAQFPLYIWLPDAMAGPTPVSALIHAATMVTAGVYLLGRLAPLYSVAHMASHVVAWTGACTALFAATIALVQRDIKKILAFSTVSQLGFMVLAMGVGAYAAGIFHLVTHAFFKALLFLAAGSVIHAMNGEQNLQKMGGLKTYLVATTILFFGGYFAIVGMPSFSGWFSKDEIIHAVLARGFEPQFWIAVIAALCTAFYMTRMAYLTFLGTPRATQMELRGVHESPAIMLLPMLILALLSWAAKVFPFDESLVAFFPTHAHGIVGEGWTENEIAWTLTAGVFIVMAVTVKFYSKISAEALSGPARFERLRELLEQQYQWDRILAAVGGQGTGLWARMLSIFDVKVIDRAVNGVASFFIGASEHVAKLQNGKVQAYAFSILGGCILLALYMFAGRM